MLPKKRSLLKWVENLPKSPGLSDTAKHAISSKVRCMDDKSKLCTVSMDEISLKTSLLYDPSRDEVVGVEDFGNGQRSELLATSAIVFMPRGITSNWKQPLCYFFVHESCPSHILKGKLFEIITQVQSVGLKVCAVISDLGSNFQKLLKDLNVTPSQPWFTHNGQKIFYIFDPPHLIKAVRNNLVNYDFHFGSKVASWKDIVAMYERDKTLSIRCCPKLTDRHMYLNGFTKMKVKYATQVLSHSVAATILMSVSLNALPQNAAGTAELVSNFDSIFDCLNSSSTKGPKIFRRAISEHSNHKNFLTDMLLFIQSIKVVNPDNQKDVTSNLKCLDGLCLTINGVLSLWEVLQRESVGFLCTRRLNQDSLENFFGAVRQRGGNADNPTPLQFTRAFKKLFYENYLDFSTGNCTDDLDRILVGEPKKANPLSAKTDEMQPCPFVIDETDYKTCLKDNAVGMNAVTYVAGYLVKKCLKKHSCQICMKQLIVDGLSSDTQLLCLFKEYDDKERLITPAAMFVDYVANIETIFVNEFKSNTSKVGIGKYLLSILPQFTISQCSCFPSVYLLKLFIKMRIHYALKFGNRELQSGKKKNKKYLKVSHL